MRKPRPFFRRMLRRLAGAAAVCAALWLLLTPVDRVLAQAIPAATSPAGDVSPTDQPLVGQSLGSSLTLNQGVNAINAENQSFERYGLGLSASGGEQTNFLGTQTNQQNAAYMQFMANGGLILRSTRTRYYLLYQPQYTWYPQFSEVNNFGQTAYQTIDHVLSERAGVTWNTTAARYLSLNQFLPQTLGIGGIGVVVPTPGTQLLENSFELTNAATSVTFRYLMSPRMTFTGSATGAFFLMVPANLAGTNLAGTNPNISERFLTSGADLRLDYQWTTRDTFGAEITPIYSYGLQPTGHESAETVQATYQRQLSPTWIAKVGAGPLFIQTSLPQFGSTQDTSYAVSASISRQVRQSEYMVGFSRALIVNLLSPSYEANSLTSSAYLPLGTHWIFSGAASYARYSGAGFYGTGSVYGGSAQMAYQVTRKVQLFGLYSLLSENFSTTATPPVVGFTRNQFTGGIQFNLGNPITNVNPGNSMTSGGMQ